MLFLKLIFVILFYTTFADKTKEYYNVNDEESLNSLFESFLQEHDKNYDCNEKNKRLNIFRETLKEINRLNDEHPHTIFGITYFADLTAEEMQDYRGHVPSTVMGLCTELGDPTTQDSPAAYDWRQQNAVTPVKNQKNCGSCWAFSATATVESRYAMKTGQQVDLSEQQLVDCDVSSAGCGGGYAAWALTSLIWEGGQEQEENYKYAAATGTCHFNSSNVAVKVASCNTYNLTSEDALKELLFKEGPLSIAIDSTIFKIYSGGIVTLCYNLFGLNHAVQLVGYGSENGTDYWIIKNSWGAGWGENGFVRVQRGVQCLGLLNELTSSATLLIFMILFHTTFADKTKEYYDVNDEESVNSLFESFLQEHDKNYDGNEKKIRLNIFRESLEEINRLNDVHPGAIFGINHLADLTAEEMKAYKGFLPSLDKGSCTKLGDPITHDAPAAYDWRQHGAVTPVKDQKHCGSCWAFSATATMESKYAMKSGQQLDLSEQQLVDCDKTSDGCNGGLTTLAFTSLIEGEGQEQEEDYKYTAIDGTCLYNSSKVAVKVASCNTYNLTSEDALKELLFKEGPLSISVDAKVFQFYNSGIMNVCFFRYLLDHAVQLVGYGTENGQDYWIIKNSWSAGWGENGYIRIARGADCCGLLNTDVSTVTLV